MTLYDRYNINSTPKSPYQYKLKIPIVSAIFGAASESLGAWYDGAKMGTKVKF